MSLYNMVCQADPAAGFVLMALGFETPEKRADIPRVRDAYIIPDHEGHAVLGIFTRSGGGNRSEYADQNAAMRDRPGFILDKDDTHDSTYAHFLYEVPEDYKNTVAEIIVAGRNKGYDFPTPTQRFQRVMDAMK